MNQLIISLCSFLFLSFSAFAQYPSIIPEPSEITWLEGNTTINAETTIMGSAALNNEKNYLAQFIPCKIDGKSRRNTASIFLDIDARIQNEEAYHLHITANKIQILGSSPKGIFNGIQTLLQMMPAEVYKKEKPTKITVPNVRLYDEPAFPWRGLLLDCSRHFMEKEFVLRYIDLLAYHKMNTLHWHITEDQGWRIEIKKYPKLTEVGAWREDVNDEMEGDSYGGFYTQEDIKEIVAYAAERHINVIPEIEMPGHCQAALAAYPKYSCTGGPFEVETEWGVFKEIYCAGNQKTYTFLTDILEEVLTLFPSKYIHIGGDEVPKYRWEHCKKCQKHMAENGLENAEDLQSNFLGQINDYLKSKGRIMVGWDEIAEGGLPDGAVVQSWRGMEGAEHAIAEGHSTIVSPTSHAYFDYDLKSIDLEKVYSFDPIPESISEKQKALVLGGECNMWSERAPQETVDSKVFPRLLAMSEVLWSYPEKRDYAEFYQKVQSHYERLNAIGVDYGFETLPFSYKIEGIKNGWRMCLIPSNADLNFNYQVNDGEWQAYRQNIGLGNMEIVQSKKILINTYKDDKKYGETFEFNYSIHKGRTKNKFTLLNPYSDSYTGGGQDALRNGFKGSTDFRDGHWQGYWGKDLVATYEFNHEGEEIQSIKAGFLQYNNSWIFMPTALIVEVSEDGVNYQKIGETKPTTEAKTRGKILETLSVEFEKTKVKHLRVTAKNFGQCPDWHEAAGSDAWLFVDEIEIF